MNIMKEKKILFINLVASIFCLSLNIIINLLVMPIIVNKVGAEAYGFVNLANNIVNYATIITIALDSVAARFIAIEMHRGNVEAAKTYFNCVFWADVLICFCIIVAGSFFVWKLNSILVVSDDLFASVRQLFVWLILNFVISVIGTIFTVSTYITNRLYISSIITSVAITFKAVFLLIAFKYFSINIIWVGIASFIYSFVVLLLNSLQLRRLTPELKINVSCFSIKKTVEMISSGIWSSISKLSTTISDGLDTVITNVFLTASDLGDLSIAYTIPTLSSALISTICNLFNPKLTFSYAENNMDAIVDEIKTNMKLTGVFACVLFCGIITYGREFFLLMVPNENIDKIYSLACLCSVSLLASGVTTGLSNVFVLTNKLKGNSIVWLCVSFFDIVMVLLLVKNTSLGIFAVAGVSKIVALCMNLVYLPIYACVCLNIKKTTFYPLIIRYLVVLAGTLIVFTGLKSILRNGNSWLAFSINALVCAIVGGCFSVCFLMNSSERKSIVSKLRKKVKIV